MTSILWLCRDAGTADPCRRNQAGGKMDQPEEHLTQLTLEENTSEKTF